MSTLGVDQLVAQIIAIIYQNSAGDVSGQELQDQLVDVVDSLNQGLYNNLIPYNVGQSVIIDNGGTKELYICVTATTAGESPITTPSRWDLTSGSGVVLDEIVLSVSALKAVTGYSNDDQALINDNNGLYGFDSTSTAVNDDDLVIIPDDITHPAPGRWLKIKTLVDTTTTGVLGDLISPVTTDLVDAINAIAVNGIEIVTNITALKAIPSARREFKTAIIKFYDEGDEGAVSGGIKKILFYRGPDLTNSEWEDLTNWQSLTPTITSGFTSTATNLEGVPSGTVISDEEKIEDLMTLLLNPYIASIISSFTLQDTPSVVEAEVGATILIDSVTIGVTNDSDGSPPASLNIAGTGYNSVGSVGVNTPPAPPLNVQQTTDASEIWTVTGIDGEANPINQLTVQIDWLFTHFVGANSTVLTGSSTDGEVTTVIDALQISSLETDQEKIVIATSDFANTSNFTYIAYAAKYGDLSEIILNGGINVLSAFTKLGDFNYTNSEAHIESYRVYKSNATGAFENGDELNIS